jgi:hypothetical protein
MMTGELLTKYTKSRVLEACRLLGSGKGGSIPLTRSFTYEMRPNQVKSLR